MTRAVFPGTFDPITKGHEAIARRAAAVFDELIIGVAAGVHKRAFFSLDERLSLTADSFRLKKNIRIDSFDGLLVDFMHKHDCKIIVRGLRVVSDFEFESQMANVNRVLDEHLETLFFFPDRDFTHLSSTIVREIASLGGDVQRFVAPHVARLLRQKLKLQNHGA